MELISLCCTSMCYQCVLCAGPADDLALHPGRVRGGHARGGRRQRRAHVRRGARAPRARVERPHAQHARRQGRAAQGPVRTTLLYTLPSMSCNDRLLDQFYESSNKQFASRPRLRHSS